MAEENNVGSPVTAGETQPIIDNSAIERLEQKIALLQNELSGRDRKLTEYQKLTRETETAKKTVEDRMNAMEKKNLCLELGIQSPEFVELFIETPGDVAMLKDKAMRHAAAEKATLAELAGVRAELDTAKKQHEMSAPIPGKGVSLGTGINLDGKNLTEIMRIAAASTDPEIKNACALAASKITHTN